MSSKIVKLLIEIGVIITLISLIFILYTKYQNISKDYSNVIKNNKAYQIELNEVKDKVIMYEFKTEQLNYIQDSILIKLDSVKKELKIKDKNLNQLQYQLNEAIRKDTIRIKDTIFRDKTFKLDTLIGDKWFNIKLGLQYPNIVTLNPYIISEQYTFISSKKETINPPKKCFISRWFQKKHTIIEVEVIEKNPYIINKKQKYIKIIK